MRHLFCLHAIPAAVIADTLEHSFHSLTSTVVECLLKHSPNDALEALLRAQKTHFLIVSGANDANIRHSHAQLLRFVRSVSTAPNIADVVIPGNHWFPLLEHERVAHELLKFIRNILEADAHRKQ